MFAVWETMKILSEIRLCNVTSDSTVSPQQYPFWKYNGKKFIQNNQKISNV